MPITHKVSPFLWFNMNAEEAVNFYTSVFKNSRKGAATHYGKGAPVPEGTVMTIAFELEGQPFTALNGGPIFKFTEAVSFVIACKDQTEIDYFWEKLTSGGGQPSQCGWLKDRFGLSWQVIPAGMEEIIGGDDPARTQRAMQAMFGMKKLDVAALRAAADGV